MILEVRHLQLIDAIAREGSVTRAGDRLHLSQSALSHQLRELEDRLGALLFHRLRKRMMPTQAGERILAAAPAILAQLQGVEEDIERLAGDSEGVMRISAECYTTYHWLPPRLVAFGARFPRIDVRVIVEAMGRPLQALLDGALDLAIVYSVVPSAKLTYHPLFRDDLVVVMRPNHPLSRKRFVEPEDFSEENLITYAGREESCFCRQVLEPAGVEPKRVWQVQLTEGMIELAKAGLGITVMARWAARPYLKAKELVALPLTREGVFRDWSAATLRAETLAPHLAEFIQLLKDSIGLTPLCQIRPAAAARVPFAKQARTG